jgi:CheY-like chemotaxis protein
MTAPGSAQNPVEILLVEDDAGDTRLTMEALKLGKISNNVHVVTDGEAALGYLRNRPPHDGAPRPDLILLDLNLPRKDGREVLADVKADPALRQIPVVILTTSGAEEDIARSYDLHANAYVRKPVSLAAFMAAVQAIDDFYFTIVRLPTRRVR